MMRKLSTAASARARMLLLSIPFLCASLTAANYAELCHAELLCKIDPAAPLHHTKTHLRLHFLLDDVVRNLFSRSWVYEAMRAKLIDCSEPVQSADGTLPKAKVARLVVLGIDPMAFQFTMQDGQRSGLQMPNHTVVDGATGCAQDLHLPEPAQAALMARSNKGPKPAAGAPKQRVIDVARKLQKRGGVWIEMSLFPDVGPESFEVAQSYLERNGFHVGERNFFITHYRSGLLKRGYGSQPEAMVQTGFELQNTIVAPSTGDAAAKVHHAFWNSYWTKLMADARSAVGPAACRGNGGEAESPACAKELALWCEQPYIKPTAPRPPPSKFLLLGGDAHYGRQDVLKKLYEGGALKDAMWSLSKPPECDDEKKLDGGWREFCKVVPKKLDMTLLGEHAPENKDETFPPRELYEQTRFSLQFESVISCPGAENMPGFFTEKVIKPLAFGHPFRLMCHLPGAVPTLGELGFGSYSYLFNETAAGVGPNFDDAEICRADLLLEELRRLPAVAEATWERAYADAHANQRHLVCPSGLQARFTSLARRYLEFVLHMKAKPTSKRTARI